MNKVSVGFCIPLCLWLETTESGGSCIFGGEESDLTKYPVNGESDLEIYYYYHILKIIPGLVIFSEVEIPSQPYFLLHQLFYQIHVDFLRTFFLLL